MKLLIIEDSQRLLRTLGIGLRKMGYTVDLVADGADGLDYARFNEYDVIVLALLYAKSKLCPLINLSSNTEPNGAIKLLSLPIRFANQR